MPVSYILYVLTRTHSSIKEVWCTACLKKEIAPGMVLYFTGVRVYTGLLLNLSSMTVSPPQFTDCLLLHRSFPLVSFDAVLIQS